MKKDIDPKLKLLKQRVANLDETKTLENLYMDGELEKVFEDTDYYVRAYWDYDD